MAADSEAKKAWEAANVIVARTKINRNQDPELYEILTKSDNIGQTVRELLRIAIKSQK
jgi:hypothetical protein